MRPDTVLEILKQVQSGALTPEDAEQKLKISPFEDLGFAKVDHHRGLRQGVPEVIYGAGKTPEQIAAIARAQLKNGDRNILITRLSPEAAALLQDLPGFRYDPVPHLGVAGACPAPKPVGRVVVACAGTSDLPVAEEAAQTAEALGSRVERLTDVGVAGLQRLLAHVEDLAAARVVVAVARGMEGALAQRHRRAVRVPGHRGADECRVRCQFRGIERIIVDAQFLRERCERREHRQRLWRGLFG